MQTALAIAVILCGAGAARAQSAPAFEAASVKLVPADDPTHRSAHSSVTRNEHGARISLESTTLKDLVMRAYGVAGYQVAGPEWIASERYDVMAVAAAPADSQAIALMFQSLLADRFQLAQHRETKTGPLYRLGLAKGGPKLREGEHGVPAGMKASSGKLTVKLTATNQSMAALIDAVAETAGRPIVDETGLSGVYHFELEYARTDDSPAAPLAAALEEQLGLKLTPSRGPVEMLIIDRALRSPTAN